MLDNHDFNEAVPEVKSNRKLKVILTIVAILSLLGYWHQYNQFNRELEQATSTMPVQQ